MLVKPSKNVKLVYVVQINIKKIIKKPRVEEGAGGG